MSMEKVKKLMRKVGWGSLATTDGHVVGVRPMAGWSWFGRELWCATGAGSDKVAQLKKVAHGEYCFGAPDGLHVRIAGPCTISTDNGDKLQLYQACPLLAEHISDPASDDYVVIRMAVDRVRMMNVTDLDYEEISLD